MYKSNGNYEAFAQTKPGKEIEDKKAFLVGAGLASLAAATFLIRNAKMNPENIHIFEELSIAGGSLDGILIQIRASLVVVDEKWKTILNVYEIYFALFHL